jgi:hypothetical protein
MGMEAIDEVDLRTPTTGLAGAPRNTKMIDLWEKLLFFGVNGNERKTLRTAAQILRWFINLNYYARTALAPMGDEPLSLLDQLREAASASRSSTWKAGRIRFHEDGRSPPERDQEIRDGLTEVQQSARTIVRLFKSLKHSEQSILCDGLYYIHEEDLARLVVCWDNRARRNQEAV